MLNMEDFHVDTAKIPLSEVNYVYGVVGIWSSEGHHAHPTLLLLIPRLYGPLIALEGVQGNHGVRVLREELQSCPRFWI